MTVSVKIAVTSLLVVIIIGVVVVLLTLPLTLLGRGNSTVCDQRSPPPTGTCRLAPDIHMLLESVAVIVDVSSITALQLTAYVEMILCRLTDDYIREIIFIENQCGDEEAIAFLVQLARANVKVKLVRLDSDGTRVSRGRARLEGMQHASAPFLYFLSAGYLPQGHWTLESMVSAVHQEPETVFVPTSALTEHKSAFLTWNLSLRAGTALPLTGSNRLLPILDDSAFMIRSDLYRSVGGFDAHYFKEDIADGIAFSLDLWLCGASIKQTTCSSMEVASYARTPTETIQYLPYAKYIERVYTGKLAGQVTYPGVSHYQLSPYEKEAVKTRSSWLVARSCLPFSYYASRFPQQLPITKSVMPFYDPEYSPTLPQRWTPGNQMGKMFMLFAGQCIKADDDGLLGLEWCPVPLEDRHKFIWANGTVRSQGKCITVSSDTTFILADCAVGKTEQSFTYDKSNYHMLAPDGRCACHRSGANKKQVLMLAECNNCFAFNLIIFNNEY